MEGAVAKNTIIRLKSALVSMGYRKQGNIWGKPVGFMLIVAEVKDSFIRFASITQGLKGTICWSKSKFGFDDETTNEDFVYSIAVTEQGLHIKESSEAGEPSGKIYNFFNPEDLYHIDL